MPELTMTTLSVQPKPAEPDGGSIVNADLFAAIRSAEALTDLPFDWDDEGGKALSREHVDRVISFLRAASEWAWRVLEVPFPAPRIQPGPGDSIDLHWKNGARELLLNVPAQLSDASTFYGEVDDGDSIKEKLRGVINLKHKNYWLTVWLLGEE